MRRRLVLYQCEQFIQLNSYYSFLKSSFNELISNMKVAEIHELVAIYHHVI